MSILPNPNQSTATILFKFCGFFIVAMIIHTAFTAISVRILDVDTNLISSLTEKSERIATEGNKSADGLQNTLIYGAQKIKQELSKRDYLFIYFAQVSYNIMCFLFVGILFRKTSFPKKDLQIDWKKNTLSLYLLCPLLLMSSIPLLGETLKLNDLLGINAITEYLGVDLASKSLGNMIFSYAVFVPESTIQLLTSISFVAIIPAFGEELFFRGGLQKFLVKRFGNPHNAIFITALIFSALHLEITAFFYRFLLGVVLGYVYFWGKTIWLPILIHALNNSFSVVSMYLLFNSEDLKNSINNESELTPTTTPLVFSTVLLAIILWNFYMNYKRDELLKKDLNAK